MLTVYTVIFTLNLIILIIVLSRRIKQSYHLSLEYIRIMQCASHLTSKPKPNFAILKTKSFYVGLLNKLLLKAERNTLFVISLCLFFSAFVLIPLDLIPPSPAFSYTVLVLLAFTNMGVLYIRNTLKKETGLGLFLAVLYATGFSLVSGVSYFYLIQDKTNPDFKFVLLALFNFLSLIFTIMFYLLTSSKRSWLILLITILGIMLSQLYILLIFGIFNFPQYSELLSLSKDSSSWVLLFQIMYLGSINVFQYPMPSQTISLEPIAQYLIWMIFNSLVLGFIVSYVTSIVLERRNTRYSPRWNRYKSIE